MQLRAWWIALFGFHFVLLCFPDILDLLQDPRKAPESPSPFSGGTSGPGRCLRFSRIPVTLTGQRRAGQLFCPVTEIRLMSSSWVDWVGVGGGQPEATGDLDRVRSARPITVGGVGPLAAVCLSDTPFSLPRHPPWEEVPCPVPEEEVPCPVPEAGEWAALPVH